MYQLYVFLDGKWVWVAQIVTQTAPEAFGRAMAALPPEHYTRPVKLVPGERGDAPPPADEGR
jgi:hypothetical protein